MNNLRIIIDTREQNPFLFNCYPCDIISDTLHTGDYSIEGAEDLCAVERKTLSDLVGCMTSGRNRFEKELERMTGYESAAVVVEEPLQNITAGTYWSKFSPISFYQSVLSFSFRYRVPFFFGHDRGHAEWICFNCLRHFFNKKKYGAKIPYFPQP